MCGVIVVDAESFWSTWLGHDAYIHDHCVGYCHDFFLFYQLPNSNLFTHREYLCSREKPLVKHMAPGSIFIILISYYLVISFAIYFTLHLYHKNTKNIILSYLSDLTLVSGRVGIDNPLSHWLRGFIYLCRYEGLVRGLLLDWYLGSQKLREILTLLCCTTLCSSRENQHKCSRGSRHQRLRAYGGVNYPTC